MMNGLPQNQIEFLKTVIIRISRNDHYEFDEDFISFSDFDIDFVKKYFKKLFDYNYYEGFDNEFERDSSNNINYANVTIGDVLANPQYGWNYRTLSENKNFNLEIILENKNLGFSLENYISRNPNVSWQDIVDYPNLEWKRLPSVLKGKVPNDYELLKKFDMHYLYVEYVDDVVEFIRSNNFEYYQLEHLVKLPKITISVLEQLTDLDMPIKHYAIFNPNSTFEDINTHPMFKSLISSPNYYNYDNMTFEELLKTKNNNVPQYGNKVAFPFSAIKEHPELFKDRFNYRNLADYFTYSSNKGLTWDVIVNNRHLPWSYGMYMNTHDDYDIDYIIQNMSNIEDSDLHTIFTILVKKLTREQLEEILDYMIEF